MSTPKSSRRSRRPLRPDRAAFVAQTKWAASATPPILMIHGLWLLARPAAASELFYRIFFTRTGIHFARKCFGLQFDRREKKTPPRGDRGGACQGLRCAASVAGAGVRT